MIRKIKIIIIAFVAVSSFSLSAQILSPSAYFMPRMNMRHTLNPALINDYGYVNIPVLNLGMNVTTNMAASQFIYPMPGEKPTTFMSERVSASQFLKGLENVSRFNFDLNTSLLSLGIFAFGGFNTFDLSFNTQNDVYIPKELFAFMKQGMNAPTATYNIERMMLSTNNYLQFSFGHARAIDDKLTVGAKIKYLAGMASAEMGLNKMRIEMGQEAWRVQTQAVFRSSVSGLNFNEDPKMGFDFLHPNFDAGQIGLAGSGFGIDLGATYKLLPELTLSAAVTDLGAMFWNHSFAATTNPDTEVEFSGFKDLSGNVQTEIDGLTKQFEDMMVFSEDKAIAGMRTVRLATKMTFGAEYSFLNDGLSAGLLSTTHFVPNNVYTQISAVANVRMIKWLTISGNYTYTSGLGSSYGAIINCSPAKIFNFFFAFDTMKLRLSPQFIPLDRLSLNFSMGFSVPLGRNPRAQKSL